MDKKTIFLISGIMICFVVIGVSFAFWYLNLEQTTPNVVTSGCFSMEFTEGNAINLNDVYPISDEEGMKLTPYTFTIQNTCTTDSSYQINLETIAGNGKVLPDKYLKASLEEGNETKIITKLDKTVNSELETETTIEGAMTAYKLFSGLLAPNEEKSYSLHLWMHSDVGPSSDSMNATYQGKINIVTSYTRKLANLVDTIKELPVVTSGDGLYEVKHPDTELTDSFSSDLTEEQINNLKQTELRYVGVQVNNYVEFNDELWRIIGLVNTPEGQRVKLIREETIGNYSWDTSEETINSGKGVNEWSQAKLMFLLNEGAYYNRSEGTCYNGQGNASVPCDFTKNGLREESKKMLEDIVWTTGAAFFKTSEVATSVIKLYNAERGNLKENICSNDQVCNDAIERKTIWKGRVGLMYPSDYGYSSNGGSVGRDECLTQDSNYWESNSDCATNSWLYKPEINRFTMTPSLSSNARHTVWAFFPEYSGPYASAYADNYIYPSVYLNLNVNIYGGDGSLLNPYGLVL